MAKIFPIRPAKPELICWGCDRYCPADNMICGNGSDRTQHPVELFGEGWETFGLNAQDVQPADEPKQPPADKP
ncbi:DUF3079 domain-containing protein [Duganella sp. BJB488]|uniref:DUF3079 domain-containing protein n=1 Tax=unclassified Duganella TaxID=2636909 RepID=UPI000E34AF82|nr:MULTISPECIES: DUF3079 domain-containing protein [unclassified Duganella]NVD71864.1 DUF3079 domain-containing protein [Duganella sp. BJB1802]RFP17738.1 DUF3079 domain-containing protein [Duganella sp. BJB489]RFP22247.1 DUF3079 domain-containing protein [Duganella sp. BJB488]RFP37580.1 DUF3079 domain-containing protein [Duganella sp. BJB480]